MHAFEEKTIKRDHIFSGRVIDLHVDTVSLPNGKQSKREIVHHPGAVAIIPITKDEKIVLVKQYRKALERTIIELPAGKIELDEKPEVTAIRELEEETGYTTDRLTYLTSFYTSPGFANELIHLYLTESIKSVSQQVKGDEDEFIEVVELSLEEAMQYVEERKIFDAKTAYAILYLQLRNR